MTDEHVQSLCHTLATVTAQRAQVLHEKMELTVKLTEARDQIERLRSELVCHKYGLAVLCVTCGTVHMVPCDPVRSHRCPYKPCGECGPCKAWEETG